MGDREAMVIFVGREGMAHDSPDFIDREAATERSGPLLMVVDKLALSQTRKKSVRRFTPAFGADGGEHVQHQPAGGTSGVHGVATEVQDAEADALRPSTCRQDDRVVSLSE